MALIKRVLTEVSESSTYSNECEKLTKELVPREGKANSVAGEILRAYNYLAYRYFNDGLRFTKKDEFEQPPLVASLWYLRDIADKFNLKRIKKVAGNKRPTNYQKWVDDTLEEAVVLDILDHPELKKEQNTTSSRSYRINEIEDKLGISDRVKMLKQLGW